MNIMTPPLTIRDGERQLCQPCLRIVLFGYAIDALTGLTSPLNAFLRRFGKSVGWYRNGFHQLNPKRLPNGQVQEVFGQMVHEINSTRGAVAELLAPSKKGEWIAPAFHYWKAGGTSEPFVMFSLPLEWIQETGAHGVEALLQEILDEGFPLASGYVGLSTLWNHSAPSDAMKLAEHFREWLLKFPGMMHPNPLMQIDFARAGLVDVGWFTLLGPMLAKRIGSREEVLSKVSEAVRSQIEVQGYKDGSLAIRAGSAPVLDSGNTDCLPLLQREIGAALSIVCNWERNGSQFVPGFSVTGEVEERRQWANRFFDRVS